MTRTAKDGEEFLFHLFHTGGQDVVVSWHPPSTPPEGRRHGAAGVCFSEGQVVLISNDGVSWEWPAGRPEGKEEWRETLEREMQEEACARVVKARLLGFGRGECVAGTEKGLVLVRSVWRADVVLEAWEPRFETKGRLVVPVEEAMRRIKVQTAPEIQARIWEEAGR